MGRSQRRAQGRGTSRSNPRRWCDSANKKRYPDHLSAVRAVSSIRMHNPNRSSLPVRAYECEQCQGWHMTAMEN